jgi:hypothetical protein
VYSLESSDENFSWVVLIVWHFQFGESEAAIFLTFEAQWHRPGATDSWKPMTEHTVTIKILVPGMMAQVCNPSNSGGKD